MPDETRVSEWVTLGAGERIVWSGRPSPYIVWRWLAIAAAVLLAGVVGYAVFPPNWRWIPLVVLVAVVPVAAWSYLTYRGVNYVVTTEKVVRKTGIVRQAVDAVRLEKVQNASSSQTFGQRLVGCGDVRIDTAGTGTSALLLRSVRRPRNVIATLVNRADVEPPDDVDVESLGV